MLSYHQIDDDFAVYLPVLFRPNRNQQDAIISDVSSQSVEDRLGGFFTQVSENRKCVDQVKLTVKRKRSRYVLRKRQVRLDSVLLTECNGLIPGIYSEDVLVSHILIKQANDAAPAATEVKALWLFRDCGESSSDIPARGIHKRNGLAQQNSPVV